MKNFATNIALATLLFSASLIFTSCTDFSRHGGDDEEEPIPPKPPKPTNPVAPLGGDDEEEPIPPKPKPASDSTTSKTTRDDDSVLIK